MELTLDKYLGACACGRRHELVTREIAIEAGAVNRLPKMAEKLGLKRGVCIISDENTYAFAELASKTLKSYLHCIKPHTVLNPVNLHADETAVERVCTQLPADAAWLLAAGSGTVHDITRYVARLRGIPFVSFPTAASVDGFASDGCAMTWYGFKKTMPGTAPLAVAADTDIFANAPYRLTASGAGDVLGKYISLADWRIANLISDEAYCPEIAALSREAVDNVRENLGAVYSGARDAREKLMYALLLSGIAMQMWGTSRPASGAEHHFSHFWEMEVNNPRLDAMHGEKVGVALNIVLPMYREIVSRPGFCEGFKAYEGFPEEIIRAKYGRLADSVIAENTPDSSAKIDFARFAASADEIRGIIDGLPDAELLQKDMCGARVPSQLSQIGLDDSCIPDTAMYAPYVRNRVTLLRASAYCR